VGSGIRAVEALGCHAHYRCGAPVHPDLCADYMRVTAKSLLPKRVSQHHHQRPSRPFSFAGTKQAADGGLNAESRKVVSGDRTVHELRAFPSSTESADLENRPEEVLESVSLLPEILEPAVRHLKLKPGFIAWSLRRQHKNFFWSLDRERTKDAICDSEHCGIGTHAQCNG